MVNKLLDSQPGVKMGDIELQTSYYNRPIPPLYMAVLLGNMTTVELLLVMGAKVDSRGNHADRDTALQTAASSGRTDIMKLLLGRRADVNMTVSAVDMLKCHHSDAVSLLAENGADITCGDDGKHYYIKPPKMAGRT